MITFRRFVPALALGLTMTVAGIGFAQNAVQGDKKADSCCCCGDSCNMKTGAMQNHAMSGDKHDCCGDSCARKDGAQTANAAGKHDCCGDSCAMMKKDGMNNHAAMAGDKHECCSGDSCNMKHDGQMNMAGMKPDAADKHAGCCCGDSCDMKDMKSTDTKPKP